MSNDDGARAEDVLRHIAYKVTARELDAATGDRMRTLLADGAPADYAALHKAATELPLPPLVFHTACVTDRDTIEAHGLRAAAPESGRYAANAVGQQPGVYVAAEPDTRGVWAHEDSWDVWEVNTTGLPYTHDQLNPGCWVLGEVPADRVRLYAADNHY